MQEGLIESVMLIDKSSDRAKVIERKLSHADSFSSISEVGGMIAGNLAIIALPHHLHAEASVDALRAGAHVLCEKPMARTVAECDTMIAAADAAGRTLAVGHFRRFFPAVKVIRKWINEEILGPLLSFRFLEGEIYSWPAASDSFFRREAAGGGVLIDAGSHTMDLV